MSRLNQAMKKGLENGEYRVAREYKPIFDKAQLVETKYCQRIIDGLNPAKVRSTAFTELESVTKAILDLHETKANELKARADSRAKDILSERQNRPDLIQLRYHEAELTIKAMSEGERLHMAQQFADGKEGLSREVAMSLVNHVPEKTAQGDSLRQALRRDNIADPVKGDSEYSALLNAADDITKQGASIELERDNTRTGLPETFRVKLQDLIDLESE